ncbi:MAG TPA: hypothetical protein VF399_04160 [bacterium]
MAKSAAPLLLIFLLLIFCAPASTVTHDTPGSSFGLNTKDAIVLSEKLGSVIDPDIRARYNLFPDLSFTIGESVDTAVLFIEARFYHLGKGGYIVRLVTTKGTYQAQNTGAKAVAILQDYFISYDSIIYYNKTWFEKKWGIVDYDILGQPITIDEVEKLTKPNPRMKYGGLGAMIVGAVLGGFTGYTVATWTTMFGGCLGGTGGSADTSNNSVLVPTLTCAGLGAVPGAAAMVTAEILKKKYDKAIQQIKRNRMPYSIK